MEVEVEYISAACNCTYNCLELGEDFILYGSNKALAIYDLEEEKVISTNFAHKGRVNCVRFVKNCDDGEFAITCCAGGTLILWQKNVNSKDAKKGFNFNYSITSQRQDSRRNTVCSGIRVSNDPDERTFIIGCISSESEVFLYSSKSKANCDDLSEMTVLQQLNLNKSLSNDLVFHPFDQNQILLALGLDTGAVALYEMTNSSLQFTPVLTLTKHEDWVRCVDFVTLDNGDILMASGSQDSFIAVWRFTKSKSDQMSSFEFQIHSYRDYQVVFDSLIIGHEGWVNSVHWNSEGQLLSCSQDQSLIIWENSGGEIWLEKSRLGVTGGMIPGGVSAKHNALSDRVVCSGFQGAIQIWKEGTLQASVTGHFRPINDMDYDPLGGNFVVTTSEDQTTRVHAPWRGNGRGRRWHEVSRPQIHGHDLFACRVVEDKIVSGAEEKILRAFQPTQVFFKNLEDSSGVKVEYGEAPAKAAFLPSLGLSNQTEDSQCASNLDDQLHPLSLRLDEDFLRSQTLWLEVSKLYGHVYEIACIATSPKDPLIASASQAQKQQFAAIILWCAKRWKNLGEFPHHKLNVSGLEFSPDGSKLLSVSRDRTWVVWKVVKEEDFRIEVVAASAPSGGHSRALWVGTWGPQGDYFVTGGRDKKLIVWKQRRDDESDYEPILTQTFPSSVSAAAVNDDNIVATGLETGEVELFQFFNGETSSMDSLAKLDCSMAHHDTVKRLRFNPKKKQELASIGSDNILKIFIVKSS